MRFPRVDRVVYEKTSLREVVCQVRFAPVLGIESEPVSEFQERVRLPFPGYDAQTVVPQVHIVLHGKGARQPVLPEVVQRREHVFLDAEGRAKISLGRDFVSHGTSRYGRWEDFAANVDVAIDATREVYDPAMATRVGLRYQNLIRRSDLGLGGCAWRSLLRPSMIGIVADDDVTDIEHAVSEFVVLAEASGHPAKARVAHGIVRDRDEACYLIDVDCAADGALPWAEVRPILDDLHAQAWDCFRYFVLESLHLAMGPRLPT